MLNNLTNFLNIIKGKMIKTKPDGSDLIVLGTKNSNYGGGYAPSAIKYEDLKADIGSGPVVDAEGNLIVANSANDTVDVANGASHLIGDFSGMLIVNDHYDGGVEMWIAGGGDAVMINHTSAAPGNNTVTQNGNGYEWTNVDNMTGPFTFTVIKTRNGA